MKASKPSVVLLSLRESANKQPEVFYSSLICQSIWGATLLKLNALDPWYRAANVA